MNYLKGRVIFIVTPLILAVLTLSLSLFIKSKVNPDTIRKEIQENLSMILENSQVVPGKVRTSTGLSIGIVVDGLKVLDANTKKPYLELKSLEINTSWSALFWGGVPVRFEIRDLRINNNNKFKKVVSLEKLQERAIYRNLLRFSTFHKDSKINFDIKKVYFNGFKQNLELDEIKFKNFRWDSYTGYEINGNIKKKILGKTYVMDVRNIGELNFRECINFGKLKTKSVLAIKKVEIDGKPIDLEDIKGTLFVATDEKGSLYGKISFLGENHFNSEVKFEDNGNISLENLDANVSIQTFVNMGLISDFAKNELNNQVALKGSLRMSSRAVEDLKIKFNTLSPLKLNIGGLEFNYALNGWWMQNKAFVEMKGRFSEGQLLAGAFFDKADSVGVLSELQARKIELKLFNVDLRKMALKKKTFFPSVRSLLRGKKYNKGIRSVDLTLEKCSFGRDILNANANFEKNGDSYKSKRIVVSFGEKGTLMGALEFDERAISGDLRFDEFDIRGVSSFLPKDDDDFGGIFNGEMKGSYSFPPLKKQNMEMNIEIRDGNFEKFKIIEKLSSFIVQIAPEVLRRTKKEKVTYLKMKSKMKSDSIELGQVLLRDSAGRYEIEGNGTVLINKKREDFPYGGSKIFMKLKDLTGKMWESDKLPGVIPVKVIANEEGWLPDLMYTINSLKEKK